MNDIKYTDIIGIIIGLFSIIVAIPGFLIAYSMPNYRCIAIIILIIGIPFIILVFVSIILFRLHNQPC